MTDRVDAVVIGAGHNGLVCAAYLARAGMKVLCLESTDTAGGMCAPRVLGDGYHFPGLAHAAYPLSQAIRRDLKLEQFGYAPGKPIDTVALDADGKHLINGSNSVSGEGLSELDEKAYPDFRQQYLAFAKAIRPLFDNKPPRLKDMEFADKTTLAKLGWNIRMGLGREAMYEFLRVATINIYDVLNEAFEDDRLKGAIAADAVMGSAMGPRTPGTVLTWLQRLQGEANGPLSLQSGGRSQLVHALTQSAEDARGRQSIWCRTIGWRNAEGENNHLERGSPFHIYVSRRSSTARCNVCKSCHADPWRRRCCEVASRARRQAGIYGAARASPG
jgi:phytoene dehydrogenase-like protein